MTLLKQSLETSLLLRPWVSMARVSGLELARWFRQSRLAAGFRALSLKLGGTNPSLMWFGSLFRLMLAVAAIGLFVLLTYAETGLIGAMTWGLFAMVLLGWAFFRPAVLNRLTSVDLLVLAFLGSAVVSTAFSSFFIASLGGLAKMLTFVAGYAVFRVLSEEGDRAVGFFLLLLAALGLAQSTIGFYQYANHIQPLATWTDPSLNPELQMTRIFGTLKPYNPNLLAGFLIPCFAAATGMSLCFFKRKTVWAFLLLLGVAALILAAIVLTGSRGGFLAIAVMLACMFAYVGHLIWHAPELKQFRWMKPAWLTVLIVSMATLTIALGGNEQLRHRVASIFAMREDSSISYRLNVYNSATAMFRDNPVVGIGPGNATFKQVYGLYMVPGYNALGAYSVPLEIAVEQGVIGLAIFLSLLLVLMLRTAFAVDSPYLELRRKLILGALLTGILGSFAYGAFDTIWYRPSVNLLFWFMVAALAVLSEPQDANAFRGKL